MKRSMRFTLAGASALALLVCLNAGTWEPANAQVPAPTPVVPPAPVAPVNTAPISLDALVATVDGTGAALTAAQQQVTSLETQLMAARKALAAAQHGEAQADPRAMALARHYRGAFTNRGITYRITGTKLVKEAAPADLTGQVASFASDPTGAVVVTAISSSASVPAVTDSTGTPPVAPVVAPPGLEPK